MNKRNKKPTSGEVKSEADAAKDIDIDAIPLHVIGKFDGIYRLYLNNGITVFFDEIRHHADGDIEIFCNCIQVALTHETECNILLRSIE